MVQADQTLLVEANKETEEADQDKIKINNMEDILQEDNLKRFHHVLNYSSLISIQKYINILSLAYSRITLK